MRGGLSCLATVDAVALICCCFFRFCIPKEKSTELLKMLVILLSLPLENYICANRSNRLQIINILILSFKFSFETFLRFYFLFFCFMEQSVLLWHPWCWMSTIKKMFKSQNKLKIFVWHIHIRCNEGYSSVMLQ